MKFNASSFAVVLTLFFVGSSAFAETQSSIILRTGSFTMATKTQTIKSTVTFNETSTSVYSIEYERKMKDDLTWGIELAGYQNTYYSGAGTSDASHIMFNMRKYFDVAKHVQPYFGGGLGASAVRLGGVGTGTGGGFGLQLMGGVKFPFKSVNFDIEYKIISAKPHDQAGTTVDTSGNGLFAGLLFTLF